MSNLALMESLGFDLALLLQTIDDILVTPAYLMRKTLHSIMNTVSIIASMFCLP